MIITQFLGIQSLPSGAQNLFLRFTSLLVFSSFLFNLSTTFFILYAYSIIGIEAAGIVIAIRLTIQLIFDYPSGSLGDWIGQKWVFTLSLVFSAVYFYLLSFVDSLGDRHHGSCYQFRSLVMIVHKMHRVLEELIIYFSRVIH